MNELIEALESAAVKILKQKSNETILNNNRFLDKATKVN